MKSAHEKCRAKALAARRAYYRANRDKILAANRANRRRAETQSEYYRANRERLNALRHERRNERSKKRQERAVEKTKLGMFICGCGSVIRPDGATVHFRSLKHQAYMDSGI